MNPLNLYKITFLFLGMYFLLPSVQAIEPRSRAEKKVSKEVNTSLDPSILLNTKKGQVKFETWNKSMVKLDATITAEADSDAEATSGLDKVNVLLEKSGNAVHILTEFSDENQGSNFWSSVKFWESNLKLTVDIIIKVPLNADFDLKHEYGDLILPNVSNAEVNVKYGSFTCGNISENLYLDLGYSNGHVDNVKECDASIRYSDVTFNNIDYGRLDISYSKYESEHSEKLDMDSRYSKLNIASVQKLLLNGKFDKIDIDKTKEIIINSKYTLIDIDELQESADIVNSYQSTKIHNVSPNFSSINIEGKYGNCYLNIGENAQTTFELQTRYGNINLPPNARINNNDDTNTSKFIVGSIGNGKSSINISNSYGNITID